MSEYIIDGKHLIEVVRCKDCYEREKDADGDPWCGYMKKPVSLNDFCSWGWKDDGWATCKCGEELEAFGRVRTCPSCGRRLMA